jgi:hypothetical protein
VANRAATCSIPPPCQRYRCLEGSFPDWQARREHVLVESVEPPVAKDLDEFVRLQNQFVHSVPVALEFGLIGDDLGCDEPREDSHQRSCRLSDSAEEPVPIHVSPVRLTTALTLSRGYATIACSALFETPFCQSLMLILPNSRWKSFSSRSTLSIPFLKSEVSYATPHFGHLTPGRFSYRTVFLNLPLHWGHVMSILALLSIPAMGHSFHFLFRIAADHLQARE